MNRYRWNLHVAAAAIVAAWVASCAACQTNPTPPEPPFVVVDAAPTGDAAGLDDCARACLHLVALGCPEGAPADCGDVCRHTQAARLTELAPACVAKAPTAADVRACAPAWRKGCAGK